MLRERSRATPCFLGYPQGHHIPTSPAAVPVEAAEDVEPALLPAVQVQAQDGREDE